MKRLFIAISVLFTGAMAFGMDAPMADAAGKRPRTQEENLQEVPSAKVERIESESANQVFIKELQEKANLGKLPDELLIKIIDELVPAKGFGREKLYNAGWNIRSFLLSTKDLSRFAYDKDFNGKLIEKLAMKYHVDFVEAALALHTKGSQEWLEEKAPYLSDLIVLQLIKSLQDHDEAVVSWIEKAIENIPKVLADQSTDVDGFTLLMAAARANNLPLVQKILPHLTTAEINQRTLGDRENALSFAAEQGNVPMMQAFLARGAQVFWDNNDHVETDIWSALTDAIAKGQLEAVQLLLSQPGVAQHINDRIWDGRTALELALDEAEKNKVEIIKLLLAVPDISLDGVLWLANGSASERIKIMDLLIEAGADVNDNSAEIPLIPVIESLSKDEAINVINFLLSKGADINLASNVSQENVTNLTPLMVAAQKGKKRIVEFLIYHGANALLKDSAGQTALDYAKKSNSPQKDKIVQIIAKAQFEQAQKEKKEGK